MTEHPRDNSRQPHPLGTRRPDNNELWRQLLTGELPALTRGRRVLALIPSNPRCKLCSMPFRGIGGAALRMLGRRRAPSNPYVCNHCERFARDHPGGAEIDLTLLFADVRGSTTMAEGMSPTDFSALMQRFFHATTEAMFATDGLIDKLVGDEVIGVYLPAFARDGDACAAVAGARMILDATVRERSNSPRLPVGIGVNTGRTYFGTVGDTEGYSDVTVLGDTVNVAARLASAAGAGEALISAATARACPTLPDNLERRSLSLKGRATPVEVAVLKA